MLGKKVCRDVIELAIPSKPMLLRPAIKKLKLPKYWMNTKEKATTINIVIAFYLIG